MKTDSNIALKIACAAGVITLLVYLRSLSCGFVNLDDPLYVLDNPIIRNLDWSLFTSVFTRTYLGWWMPLTWISLAVDYHFWELNPFGYHLTNIVLHAVNTGLVVLIANMVLKGQVSRGKRQESLTRWQVDDVAGGCYPAVLLLAGLLWGIHPLRVESVAWVTERKDVLNGLFALSSILFYLRYVQLKESGNANSFSLQYVLAIILFMLSLMAKSVSVIIPAVLLVLDWYPLERLKKCNFTSVLIEKIPFFAVSAAMTAITFYFAAEANSFISNENLPLSQRLVVSGNAIFEYGRFLIYPVGIAPMHLIPDPIPFAYTVKTIIIILLIALCIFTAGKKGGGSAVLLCFLFPLLPVLAFFQNGDQAFAARFTYLPSVAPCIAAAIVAIAVFNKVAVTSNCLRFVSLGVAPLLLIFYVVMSLKLIPVWDSPETYWNRVIEVEPSAVVFKERALLFVSIRKYNEAVDDYTAAIRNPINVWQPYIYNLYAFRGEALSLAGRYDEAVKDLSTAIGLFQHPVYYRLRGIALKASGKENAAEDDFRRAGGEVAPLAWYWSKVEAQK